MRGVLPGTILQPIAKVIERWIIGQRPTSATVADACGGVEELFNLVERRPANAASVRWISGEAKAYNVLTILRAREVSSERVLAVYLAVAVVLELAGISGGNELYRRTQTAKALHRLARMKPLRITVRGKVREAHFPARGLYLPKLGEILDGRCGEMRRELPDVAAMLDEKARRSTRLRTVLSFLTAPTATLRVSAMGEGTRYVAAKVDPIGKPIDAPEQWKRWVAG